MERAQDEVALRQHIQDAYRDAGFTDTEWVELYQFKEKRNQSTHTSFVVTEAYDIVLNCMPESTSSDLRSGLHKAVNFHEQTGNNWMAQYLYILPFANFFLCGGLLQ